MYHSCAQDIKEFSACFLLQGRQGIVTSADPKDKGNLCRIDIFLKQFVYQPDQCLQTPSAPKLISHML